MVTARKGKVAVITGASSGIGAATAIRLAQGGHHVVLTARRRERLEQVAEHIYQEGGTAQLIVADLTREEERLEVFQQVISQHGHIDTLINNAGFGWYGYTESMPWPLAHQMLQVNILALAQLTLLFLPGMKARDEGHIINVGSIVGSLPSQGVAVYGATKAFIDAFTASIYRELSRTQVRISVVRSGAVSSEFFEQSAGHSGGRRIPLERFSVSPEQVASRISGLLKRPQRVAYVPRILAVVPWLEMGFGWLIDRLGPLALRAQG